MTRRWSRFDRQDRLLRRARHLLDAIRRRMDIEAMKDDPPPAEYSRIRRLSSDINHELRRKT